MERVSGLMKDLENRAIPENVKESIPTFQESFKDQHLKNIDARKLLQ